MTIENICQVCKKDPVTQKSSCTQDLESVCNAYETQKQIGVHLYQQNCDAVQMKKKIVKLIKELLQFITQE